MELSRRGMVGILAGAPALAALATPAAAADDVALAAFKKAIRAQYDLKEKAFAQHDAETIVNKFYAADVVATGEDEGVSIGRSQLLPLYQKVVAEANVRVESFYTYVNGNAGWDWTDFHVLPTNGKDKPFIFRCLFLWAKENDQWMCKGDMYFKGSFTDKT